MTWMAETDDYIKDDGDKKIFFAAPDEPAEFECGFLNIRFSRNFFFNLSSSSFSLLLSTFLSFNLFFCSIIPIPPSFSLSLSLSLPLY
jgi:hypothetical protein